MKLTKLEHACFMIEKDGSSLIVDPGDLTTNLDIPNNVVAIIVTHEHHDHFDLAKLMTIVEKNPQVVIVGHDSIVKQIIDLPTISVKAGDKITIQPFDLEFFGGKHQIIHTSIPIIDNLGVMINEKIYYPGDSYSLPGKEVEVLAVPTSGPWLKIGDVIDFILTVDPELAFSTHDAHSSDKNIALVDRMLTEMLTDSGIEYRRLREPIEL